jgi:hypothetical protein
VEGYRLAGDGDHGRAGALTDRHVALVGAIAEGGDAAECQRFRSALSSGEPRGRTVDGRGRGAGSRPGVITIAVTVDGVTGTRRIVVR